jgi:hypothetical protein
MRETISLPRIGHIETESCPKDMVVFAHPKAKETTRFMPNLSGRIQSLTLFCK